ncbi:dynamin-related protein 4C-like protein, partial [Tanacetum coccineum]
NEDIGKEMRKVIVRGGGIEKMLDEPPSVAIKREKLQRSIGLLKESKEVIEQVMDESALVGSLTINGWLNPEFLVCVFCLLYLFVFEL